MTFLPTCGDGHHIADALTHLVSSELSDQQCDDLLVQLTARAMTTKLRRCREFDMKSGWQSTQTSNAALLKELEELSAQPLTEGNIVDMINLLAMIRVRLMLYGEKA